MPFTCIVSTGVCCVLLVLLLLLVAGAHCMDRLPGPNGHAPQLKTERRQSGQMRGRREDIV